MYKLIKNYGQVDITNRVDSITRRSNIEELAEQLEFNFAYSDVNLTPVEINPGNLIILFNDAKEIYRGLVIDDSRSGRNARSYSCMDYGFYLNKNQEVYQFNTTASNAIRTICMDFDIAIGDIVDIPTRIKKIYTGELSDTIKDILEQSENDQGKKYRFEMREGKFYVEEKIQRIIRATTNAFGSEIDITELASNPSMKRSIENMKNSIKIVQGGEEYVTTLATAHDSELIRLYGKLQEVHSVDEKDISKAKNIAENLLKDLGKINEEVSLELVGNDDVRAGRVLEITEEITGIKGLYLIKDCTHEIKNGFHKMSLGLELI